MPTPNREFAEYSILRTINLQAVATWMVRELIQKLRELESQVAAKVIYFNPNGGRTPATRKDRLKSLLADIETLIKEAYAEIKTRMGEIFQDTADAINDTDRKNLFAIFGFKPSSQTKLAGIAGVLILGATYSDWLSSQAGDLNFRYSTAIKKGMDQGESGIELGRRVTGEKPKKETPVAIPRPAETAERNIEVLARTGVESVGNEVPQRIAAKVPDSIRAGWQQISVLDSRTTEICRAYAFKIWDKDFKPVGHDLPFDGGCPRHWACLLGDTFVTPSGEITGITKRFFKGNVFRIKTAAGNKIVCTPNHPILTAQGWQRADSLDCFSRLVSYRVGQNPSVTKWKNQNRETSIEEMFNALALNPKLARREVPTAAPDFHGDGLDGEIAVEITNGGLPLKLNASINHHFEEFVLKHGRPSIVAACLDARRTRQQFTSSFASASGGDMSQFQKPQAFMGRRPFHAGKLLFAGITKRFSSFTQNTRNDGRRTFLNFGNTSDPNAGFKKQNDIDRIDNATLHTGCTHGNASFDEKGVYGESRDAKLASDILAGKTGLIQFDDVTDIQREFFHGNVFNLETTDSFYVANNIINHNCRSSITMIVLDEEPISEFTFRDWLNTIAPADQDRIFGKKQMELYRAGKITDAALIRQQQRALSPDDLRKEPDPRLPKD